MKANPIHTYAAFSYDNNGNMTTSYVEGPGTTYYYYDYENRLVKMAYPDGTSTEFVYDPLGRRIKTLEKNSSGNVTGERHYVYDGLDLIAELDEDNHLVARYTYGPEIDNPISVRLYGPVVAGDYFYHKNHQGSITEITDSNQSIVKQYKYDAYGMKYYESGLPLTDEFAYTARELHDRTGLYYYRSRFYSPQLGRFISQDPIGLLGGTNLYAYVGNNPVNLIDPLGLCEREPNKWAAMRTAIQIADIIPIPHPYYQIPMELAAFGTSAYDIYIADVSIWRKLIAGGAAIYGLGGTLQAFPTPQNVIVGTAIDASSFVIGSYALGNEYPGVDLVVYLEYVAEQKRGSVAPADSPTENSKPVLRTAP